ncbi:uncharacterized protein LOC133527198 [Cydia pomonella]|uniref:uncharacterized protein LOC133527198 n=1 Tax=Cydia pomonella TaxID=82600 RepID=UPI002ADDE915|nr:uncharacterized protein LOC133527198 [Cydia pomonella]
MNRNINWPSSNNIHHATRREPRFLTSQIWMNQLENDMQAHGVEIVEINSADSSQSSSEGNENPKQHPWSYASKINREKSEENSLARPRNINGLAENNGLHNELDGSLYFNNCRTPDTAEIEAFNQTCFNILDKLAALKVDSSPEDFDSDEAPDGDMDARWNGKDNEELIFSSDLDPDNRAIWIYSFNNRRLLSEDSYELVNIRSRETISSDNSSEIDTELNTSKTSRVPSPIPATHIPRLDLSLGATLPNVTEVTEPKSSESLNRKYVPIRQKPTNNWCVDNSEKATENNVTNIVNWMALSPREKRHSRHINAQIQLQTVVEVPQDEDRVQVPETNVPDPAIFEAKSNREDKLDKSDEIIIKTPSQNDSQRSSTSSKREQFVDNATYLISPFVRRGDLNPFTENETEPTLKNKVRSALDDRQIKKRDITVSQSLQSPVTKPIENLKSHDLIAEYGRKGRLDRRVKSAGDTYMINNLYLPNPQEWKSYLSVPATRRSIEQGPEVEANNTLLQSCVSCFGCCK